MRKFKKRSPELSGCGLGENQTIEIGGRGLDGEKKKGQAGSVRLVDQ
jgi:hypothetical protein